MTHKTEVHLSLPNIEDLYCINCKVNPLDMQDPLIKSLFHCQILTCRLIIYTVRCCIASPSIQNVEDSIHVIVSKEFYASGKLQEHLRNLKVQFTNAEPAHQKIYEACLKYTITFKLAPLWNAVGKSFYLRGFNFLSLPTNIVAIEWNILFKRDSIKLEIIPMRISLSFLNLESLGLPCNIIDNFQTNSKNIINSLNLTSFQCPWVYVLPKLTKARVISVSKSLPDSSPFNNYDDLRRHWKNMYSYRLPKTDQGILFYEVVFSVNQNQHFIYPEMCILSRMPEILICEDKNKIAAEFIKDLSTNVHSICGKVMNIGQQYPEIDIEYSYTLKRKKTTLCDPLTNQFKSPFFASLGDTSTKTTDGRIDLSSLFTFKGMNKMRSPMRKHSEQVLSIMGNQKLKKTKKMNNNTQLVPHTFPFRTNKKMPSFFNNSIQNSNPEKERAFLGNLDDVISYYDLPSMRPNNFNQSNVDDNLSSKLTNTSEESKRLQNQNTVKLPVIKNIENVHYDLKGFKQIRTNHTLHRSLANFEKLKSKKNSEDHVSISLLEEAGRSDLSGISNKNNTLINDSKNHSNDFIHSNYNQHLRNKLKSLLYSDPSEFMQNNETMLEKQDYMVEQNSIEKDSKISDYQLRSKLSKFDLENIYNVNNVEVDIELPCKQKDTLYHSQEMKKLEGKLNEKMSVQYYNEKKFKILKDDFEIPQINENDHFDCTTNLDQNSPYCSPLLPNKRIHQKNINFYVSQPEQSNKIEDNVSYERNTMNFHPLQCDMDRNQAWSFNNNNNWKESNESSLFFEGNYNAGNEKVYCTKRCDGSTNDRDQIEPGFLKAGSDASKEREYLKSLQEKMEDSNSNNLDLYGKDVFDVSRISVSTFDMYEGSINRKLLLEHSSPHDANRSNKNSENEKELAMNKKYIDNGNDKNINESQYSPSIFETYEKENEINSNNQNEFSVQNMNEKKINLSNLQQHSNFDTNITWMTPSSTSKNFTKTEGADICKSSAGVFKLNSKLQDGEVSNLEEFNQLRCDSHCKSDFLSILSQSSDESDTINYENYKQAYTESLSFN